MIHYRHTQIGNVILVAVGAAIVAIGSILWSNGFNWVGLLVLIVLAVCLGLFSTLTVIVDHERLTLQFGLGMFHVHFLLRNIISYRLVRNPWYYGWGIRYIFDGWLFNVSGFSALELRMKNGRRFRIGTDDPAGLFKAVEQTLAYVPGRLV